MCPLVLNPTDTLQAHLRSGLVQVPVCRPSFTAYTVLLMLLAMAFGAAALGPRFRLNTVVTIALLATFGALTGSQAAAVETNTPTPWIGLYERLNIGVFLVWTVVLAGTLLRGEGSTPARTPGLHEGRV